MSKDIPTADVLEWCKERNYALVAREDFPYLFKDIVKCGDCKWYDKDFKDCNIRDSYGWEYKPTDFCSHGERRTK